VLYVNQHEVLHLMVTFSLLLTRFSFFFLFTNIAQLDAIWTWLKVSFFVVFTLKVCVATVDFGAESKDGKEKSEL
jgi:hypothetical protein